MPRKQKKGLDFFYLQCDIFSKNSELRPLLQRYKADGLAVYLHILCDVYSNGYYFKTVDFDGYLWDIAEDCGITVEKVQLILKYLQNVSLIESYRFECITILTSHGIQKHYVEAMKYRKHSVAEIKGEYWLLDEKEESKLDTFYKSQPCENKSEIYSDKSEIYSNNSEIYGTKEIKGNKTKENIDSPRTREESDEMFDIPISEWTKSQKLFYQAFDIQVDNYGTNLRNMDFSLLYSAYSQSAYLQQDTQAQYLSWICRHYDKIVGGYYKDKQKRGAKKTAHDTLREIYEDDLAEEQVEQRLSGTNSDDEG